MFTEFFKGRTIRGFYLPIVGAILSLAASIIYITGYTGTNYFHILAFLFPFFATIAFFGLILFSLTEKYASLALGILSFLGFLFFIHAAYLYLSTVFYDGISMQAILNINPAFTLTLLFELIAIIFANIGIYVAPRKANDDNKEEI